MVLEIPAPCLRVGYVTDGALANTNRRPRASNYTRYATRYNAWNSDESYAHKACWVKISGQEKWIWETIFVVDGTNRTLDVPRVGGLRIEQERMCVEKFVHALRVVIERLGTEESPVY